MKTFLWSIGMFVLLIVLPLAAEAQFPKPRPAAVETPIAQAPAPPIPTAPVATSAPAQAAATSSWSFWDIIATIGVALAGVFVGNQTKQTWWPSRQNAGGGLPSLAPPKNITDLLGRFADPAKRKEMDEYLLQIVQSGLPGELVKAGLGAVPGIGAVASPLEAVIRKAVIDELARRAGNTPVSP